uniref:Battenin n=1 Tax=Heterorhabditis bacteriophora TaxID=37862 RepID=A0A1I7XSS0_HETBA
MLRIFGLCNNFAYSVMLSAAQDILNKHKEDIVIINETNTCLPVINTRHCSPTSAGVVLLCNILPALIVKITCPFLLHRVPYGVRHFVICSTQALSLLVTAFADSVSVALCGVLLASFSSGLGETTYLGLAGHYSKNTIATWSSGTGMAGIVSAFSYAGLTDRHLLALSPSQAMLVMLFIPAMFAFTYYVVLVHAPTIRTLNILRPCEWFDSAGQTILNLLCLTVHIVSIPALLPSTDGIRYIRLNFLEVTLLFFNIYFLQLLNVAFFLSNAIFAFVPHLGMVSIIILYEGLIGGGSYVNTFHHIHKKVDAEIREFALSTVSLADSIGILLAAIVAIPVHNTICAMR